MGPPSRAHVVAPRAVWRGPEHPEEATLTARFTLTLVRARDPSWMWSESQSPVLSGALGSGPAPAIQDSPHSGNPGLGVSRVLAGPPSTLGTCPDPQNLPRLGSAPLPV